MGGEGQRIEREKKRPEKRKHVWHNGRKRTKSKKKLRPRNFRGGGGRDHGGR